MRGLKIVGGLFAMGSAGAVAFVLVFLCLAVIIFGFVVAQVPFGQGVLWNWYTHTDWALTSSKAAVGFPLTGYVGATGAIDGLPVPYPVTSHFGYAPDYFGGTIYHTGVDMACPVGVSVSNVMGGKVTFAGYSPAGYGNLVVVENDGVQAFYGHLSQVNVQVGDRVDAGDLVGLTGNTGKSTGPHLHWEIRVDGTAVDPLLHTLPGGE